MHDRLLQPAQSVNPEAGDHGITADERELVASRRAAERSLALFPYYRLRYGDRGSRFGWSDSGWLASLCSAEPRWARDQIEWLGVVLSSRGIPRVLYEEHLRSLSGELVQACPERSRKYRLLQTAARRIRAERTKILKAETLERLGKRFAGRVLPPWRDRIPEMGWILAAAAVDEAYEIERAVQSVEEWAADAERFPDDWIRAVHTTVAESRAALKRRS